MMTATPPVTRRPFLNEPGEGLLVSQDPMAAAFRCSVFLAVTGLDADDVIINSVCNTALPRYAEGYSTARRFSGIPAELMWLPLFWLPERVASRYCTLPEGDADIWEEDDEEWSVRVAMELKASGLYEVKTGEWVDVLALYGLDVDDPATIARITAWQGGADDDVLDSIDLSTYTEREENPDWAVTRVQEHLPRVRALAYGTNAKCLLDMLNDLDARSAELDVEAVRKSIVDATRLAEVIFDDYEPVISDRHKSEGAYWAFMRGKVEKDKAKFVTGPGSSMWFLRLRLAEVYIESMKRARALARGEIVAS